ncbi:MAG: response regulator [Acidobacteria bacterium]|nr:response regulator [Acidobacteriota bacterium]
MEKRKTGRILVVEDDESIRCWLTRLLSQEGYAVVDAATPAVGVRLLESECVDLVVLDVIFPGRQSGLDLLRFLRSHTATAEVPAIVLTGRPLTEEQETEIHTLVARVRLKPVDSKELLDLVDRLRSTSQRLHKAGFRG